MVTMEKHAGKVRAVKPRLDHWQPRLVGMARKLARQMLRVVGGQFPGAAERKPSSMSIKT